MSTDEHILYVILDGVESILDVCDYHGLGDRMARIIAESFFQSAINYHFGNIFEPFEELIDRYGEWIELNRRLYAIAAEGGDGAAGEMLSLIRRSQPALDKAS